ncbi:MAG: 30S ribosomal protein S12 methylthiotransferase RimO [Syntrophorhabdales bacterium]|jgi:ribosomal protein S12 methylthiotransferase
MRYRIVSLGCPKNLVDSEYLAGRLERAGHVLADDAQLVVINTCAFIADACSESIETILGEAQRAGGDGARLVVAGCLVDRYGDELADLLPEVDAFVGRGAYGGIERLITQRGLFKDAPEPGGRDLCGRIPRKVLTTAPTAYLKIQEGCNNRCSYCTIPSITGPLKSRTADDIKEEFARLLGEGFREFNVVGQDITSYGKDGGRDIAGLLTGLLAVKEDYFIRLLYLHPAGINDALLDLMARDERIIPYLDIPIQHSEDGILRSMNRGYSRSALERLFGKIRSAMPDSVLRTTVMVGYPGESQADFSNLCAFISEWEFDNLGAFTYSREAGTAAARMKNQVPKGVKQERYRAIMELQGAISKRRLTRLKGRTMKVVIEAREADVLTGRLLIQAPDVDGIAFIRGKGEVGQIRTGVVTGTTDYDVIVELGG